MQHFPGSSIKEIVEKRWKNGQTLVNSALPAGKAIGKVAFHLEEEWLKWACWHSCCQKYMSMAPWLRHVFFSVHCRACFCLVLFLHHHSLCLSLSITKVPKDFSHFAVVLVVNNPMQRDEHTKGQYTNAMHMHVHAFHTHTHTQCTHDIHMLVYSPLCI